MSKKIENEQNYFIKDQGTSNHVMFKDDNSSADGISLRTQRHSSNFLESYWEAMAPKTARMTPDINNFSKKITAPLKNFEVVLYKFGQRSTIQFSIPELRVFSWSDSSLQRAVVNHFNY